MNSKHFILLACMALLVGCVAKPPPAPRADRPHPFWSLSPTAKRKLVQEASKLRVGDSYETVVATLAKPTNDQGMSTKDGRPVGRSLKYYAVVWEEGLVNELHDELVNIWLDTHNVVRSISIRITLLE